MSEESAKLRMNLVAIQNVDPYAKEILDSSPHVAFYKFVNSEWEKSEIEGSFFVYSRVAEPFHSIFINNRLNTNSLVEPITHHLELQGQPPFLLYRNQRSAISGFWFYSKEDSVRVHSLLEKLIKLSNNAKPQPDNRNNHQQQQHPAKIQQQQQQFPKSQNGNGERRDVDIFSMLSKAQEDFNNSGGPGEKPSGPQGKLPQAFAGMKVSNPQPPQQMHQPAQQMHQPVQPLMRQLSNAMPDITSPNVVNFFATAAQQPNGAGPVKADVPNLQSQKNPFLGNHSVAQPVQTLDEIEKQHRVSASPPQRVEPKMIKSEFNHLLNAVSQQKSVSPLTMSLTPNREQQAGFQPQVANKPTLITPAMFQPPSDGDFPVHKVAVQSNIRPEPLTQNQLLQALNYLFETDPEFIHKVHEAYIKSFNKIVSL